MDLSFTVTLTDFLVIFAVLLCALGTRWASSSDAFFCIIGSLLSGIGCFLGLAALLFLPRLVQIFSDQTYVESLFFTGVGAIYHLNIALRHWGEWRLPPPPTDPSA